VLFVAYQAYEVARARVKGGQADAARHADQVVRAERALGLFVEQRVQRFFLPHHLVIEVFDVYYGVVHFVVPVVALAWLWRRFPARYRRWRNTLVCMGLLALAGFALYPLLPPRFLPPRFHFVDTAATIGGEGPLSSGAVKDIENPYAAMPSLHVGWSTWCALALLPTVRRRWLKVLVAAYPLATLLAVVVTANHYLLDGVGGWFVLAGGWLVAGGLARLQTRAGGGRRRSGPPSAGDGIIGAEPTYPVRQSPSRSGAAGRGTAPSPFRSPYPCR
jgi:membrane-associated phospholipid phosphatase